MRKRKGGRVLWKCRRATLEYLIKTLSDASVARLIFEKKNQMGSNGPRLCGVSYEELMGLTANYWVFSSKNLY